MAKLIDRLQHAWSAFKSDDRNRPANRYDGNGSSTRPDRPRISFSNERTLVAGIYNKLAIDCVNVDINHTRHDQNGRFEDRIRDSALAKLFSVETNIDQDWAAFFQDVYLTMFEEGEVAIVPVLTSNDPDETGSFEIYELRVGYVKEWRPRHVLVSVYDDRPEKGGKRRDVWMSKKAVAIAINPFYTQMNEANSTLKRLTRKLSLLDTIDEASASGKLDIIIQLPYVVRSAKRQVEARDRTKTIETQLKGSKYGIAYIDAAERVTQLNRPAENNLLEQIKTLSANLYTEMGLVPAVFDGTATEEQLITYYQRTTMPAVRAVVNAMRRRFLTKTARSQGQDIEYFRNPFRTASLTQMAELSDKFTRNEIMSSNEIRVEIGLPPDKNPKSDELRNSNLNQVEPEAARPGTEEDSEDSGHFKVVNDLKQESDQNES